MAVRYGMQVWQGTLKFKAKSIVRWYGTL